MSPEPKVTLQELSRLMDGEVSPSERRDIEGRLASCPLSQGLNKAFHQLTPVLSRALLNSGAPMAVQDLPALEDDTLMRVVEGQLSPQERVEFEKEMVAHPGLLREVLNLMRGASRMQAGTYTALPEEVRKRPELQGLSEEPAERPESDDEWVLLEMEVPEGEAAVERSLRLAELNGVLSARVVGPSVCSLSLRVLESARSAQSREVDVADADSHRRIASAKTDHAGRIVLKRLPFGTYDIAIGGCPTQLRLTLTEEEG